MNKGQVEKSPSHISARRLGQMRGSGRLDVWTKVESSPKARVSNPADVRQRVESPEADS